MIRTARLGVDMFCGDRPDEPTGLTASKVSETDWKNTGGSNFRLFGAGTIEIGCFENCREAEPFCAISLGREP